MGKQISNVLSATTLIIMLSLGQASAMQALNAPVTGHPNPESLFTSSDPKLHANKQVALKIVRDLLESGHWEDAPKYLTKEYIQHNPMAGSGRDAVVSFFVNVLKVKPQPIPKAMKTKVVAVQAEGEYVTVSYVKELKDPNDPSKIYTTTWFDMWRFQNGKADEHWDPQTLPGNN
jgi:predicted SnoaL-like aldol condensation-catalyzing enzyme